MKAKLLTAGSAALGMAVLILDTKAALQAAAEGITLCLQTVIPSLFPFLLLSILLTGALRGSRIPLLDKLSKCMGIPKGCMSLYLVGLVGGYPTGAQSIALSCQAGQLDSKTAKRMLSFCNNAGPAFLFGIGTVVFGKSWPCFLLWGMQIIASILVALTLPKQDLSYTQTPTASSVKFSKAMEQAVQTMGLICGWVVLFRVILGFLQRWFLWMLPGWLQIIIAGTLELTNGCCQLAQIPTLGGKMLFFSVFAGFGGLCVTLQTLSITAEDGFSLQDYLPGKLLQALYCFLLATACQILLPLQERLAIPLPLGILSCVAVLLPILAGRKRKKGVAFRQGLLYNEEKSPT